MLDDSSFVHIANPEESARGRAMITEFLSYYSTAVTAKLPPPGARMM
jgi:hypothetical protein